MFSFILMVISGNYFTILFVFVSTVKKYRDESGFALKRVVL